MHKISLTRLLVLSGGVLKKTAIPLVMIMSATLLFLAWAALDIYSYLYHNLPDPNQAAMESMPESTRIFDRHGQFLYEYYAQIKRSSVPLYEMPQHLRDATIAIEDKNFYHHRGFEPLAIMRAAKVNFQHGDIRQGASTITQQLARTIFLDRELSYSRKLKEIVLATKIEKRYGKDQILEMYLNNIPYGSVAYGVAAASEIYFNKNVRDLSLLESAYIAALPKAPTLYSPFGENRESLHGRAALVLGRMEALGYLSKEEMDAALAEAKPEFRRQAIVIQAPHFVFYVLDELRSRYGQEALNKGGLDVRTSLDLDLQRQAERIIEQKAKDNEEKYQAGNAALIAIDSRGGQVLAMVGSRNYFQENDGNFNAALSPRQPGSSFKPYVYAAAIENGLHPDDIIIDTRTDFALSNHGIAYIPRNYTGRHYGAVTVRRALAGSLNMPAVRVLVDTGLDPAIDTAEKLGLTTLRERRRFGPALALGGGEVKLIEHTAAFGAFGNGGIKQELSPILMISDRRGRDLYLWRKSPGIQAVEPYVAYYINNILSDEQARLFIFGNNRNLKVNGHRTAVKTGTTQDFRDAWTVGYTPSLAVGVWVGNSDNSPMNSGADGSVVAAPIWREFLEIALADREDEDFPVPEVLPEHRPKVEIAAATSTPALINDTSVAKMIEEKTVVISREGLPQKIMEPTALQAAVEMMTDFPESAYKPKDYSRPPVQDPNGPRS